MVNKIETKIQSNIRKFYYFKYLDGDTKLNSKHMMEITPCHIW